MDPKTSPDPLLSVNPIPVTAALQPWVADLALVRPDSTGPLVHPPDTTTALVYRRTDGGEGELRVVGPRSRASYHPGKDLPVCVRLRLRPGAAWRVLGVPVSELRDDGALLADVWGGRASRLEDRLSGLDDVRAIARVVEDALRDRLPDDLDVHDHLLREAVAALSRPADSTAVRIGPLARQLSVSERRLRTLFTDRVGLSPKHVARVQRVRSVLAAAGSAGSTPWARLASEAGYYDQSHMTADFHLLMGASPAAFTAGHLPDTTPCAVRVPS